MRLISAHMRDHRCRRVDTHVKVVDLSLELNRSHTSFYIPIGLVLLHLYPHLISICFIHFMRICFQNKSYFYFLKRIKLNDFDKYLNFNCE